MGSVVVRKKAPNPSVNVHEAWRKRRLAKIRKAVAAGRIKLLPVPRFKDMSVPVLVNKTILANTDVLKFTTEFRKISGNGTNPKLLLKKLADRTERSLEKAEIFCEWKAQNP